MSTRQRLRAYLPIVIVALLSVATARAQSPTWVSMELTDARTGAVFTLHDLRGRTVFLEPMATWCGSCRRQLVELREVVAELDPERFAFIGLSVETVLDPAELVRYADAHGFDWTFAVATPELLRALTESFGFSVTNPPATPHVVIGPDGSVGDLATGFHTADRLVATLEEAAAAP
jgi:thiol-disulfide isomerase/thioredoxin